MRVQETKSGLLGTAYGQGLDADLSELFVVGGTLRSDTIARCGVGTKFADARAVIPRPKLVCSR